MYTERMQILLTPEQRRNLREESRKTGESAAAIVREALDARLGAVPREGRISAFESFMKRKTPFVPIEELSKIIDEQFDNEAPG